MYYISFCSPQTSLMAFSVRLLAIALDNTSRICATIRSSISLILITFSGLFTRNPPFNIFYSMNRIANYYQCLMIIYTHGIESMEQSYIMKITVMEQWKKLYYQNNIHGTPEHVPLFYYFFSFTPTKPCLGLLSLPIRIFLFSTPLSFKRERS